MNFLTETVIGILMPFVGTTVGAATVFFMKKQSNPRFHRAMLGFAAGVMTAASVWSLLIPSIESAGSWIPAVTGFLIGTAAMTALDAVVPTPEPKKEPKLGENLLLFIAVTLHNIPEGMAVGVAFAGAISGVLPISEALTLSIGISVQNFPEGTIISAPLVTDGMNKRKAFAYGVLSGAVEPVASIITVLLTWLVAPILPFVLSFAAGAMIYVVSQELIPEAKSRIGTAGTAVGFALMMLLDVAMG
mgnify:CR=1 FL=1